MDKITDQEISALYYHLVAPCADWTKIYSIAVGQEKANRLTESSKRVTASRWKNSHRIQKALEQIKADLQRKKEEIEQFARMTANQGEQESTNREEEPRKNETDFLNRDEFLKFLNQRANKITDDKLRNDILKMLSDNMRYKESESETTEIQRFYTPVCCQDCEIYRKCSVCSLAECPKM